MKTKTTFKRVSIGSRFNWKGSTYRKVSSKGAFFIKPSGTGETHAEIPFSRSQAVTA